MAIEDKLWGSTTRLFIDAKLELTLNQAVPGGHSSIHMHREKSNVFGVVMGHLLVRLYDSETKEVTVEELIGPGGSLVVHAGQLHQFSTNEHTIFYETYLAASGEMIDPGDIVRYSEGGVACPTTAS